jgi:hypothetical protein
VPLVEFDAGVRDAGDAGDASDAIDVNDLGGSSDLGQAEDVSDAGDASDVSDASDASDSGLRRGCLPCGDEGDPCCSGQLCRPGFTCLVEDIARCRACGTVGGPCCGEGGACVPGARCATDGGRVCEATPDGGM